jgi:hypothetical protein
MSQPCFSGLYGQPRPVFLVRHILQGHAGTGYRTLYQKPVVHPSLPRRPQEPVAPGALLPRLFRGAILIQEPFLPLVARLVVQNILNRLHCFSSLGRGLACPTGQAYNQLSVKYGSDFATSQTES